MGEDQCDHMARLFVQYLPIYSNQICPISTAFYQSGLNIFQTPNTPSKIAKGFLIFCQSGKISWGDS